MKSMVVYGSHFGNTRQVAEAIAAELEKSGPVLLVPAEGAPSIPPEGTDLVVVGGPTEAHRLTAPLEAFFGRLSDGALYEVAAASFDTRVSWPRWLSGSAAAGIARRLHHAGARLVAPEESFFVRGGINEKADKGPHLDPGELDRATAWAKGLAARATRQPVAAGA